MTRHAMSPHPWVAQPALFCPCLASGNLLLAIINLADYRGWVSNLFLKIVPLLLRHDQDCTDILNNVEQVFKAIM
jgi:hypothetical protein